MAPSLELVVPEILLPVRPPASEKTMLGSGDIFPQLSDREVSDPSHTLMSLGKIKLGIKFQHRGLFTWKEGSSFQFVCFCILFWVRAETGPGH